MNIKGFSTLLLALSCGVFLQPEDANAALRNYENDLVLEKAMSYDAEYNGGKHIQDAQQLAEQHYLEYLKTSTNSAQRAKVYVQLGVLFGANFSKDHGGGADYDKCVKYMKLALKEEPKRVGEEMIRARLFLVTPKLDRTAHFEQRLKSYQWLTGLDEQFVKNNWLPILGEKRPEQRDLKVFMNYLTNVTDSETTNMVSLASNFKDPAPYLERLVKEAPGTPAADKAKALLNQ